MNIPDPSRVTARFGRSRNSYEEQAVVQKDSGEYLLDLLSEIAETRYHKVLEIGSCTGRMTESLCKRFSIGSIVINDLVQDLCEASATRVEGLVGDTVSLPGNIEKLSIPSNLDLIVSSSTFQWLHDYPHCIGKLIDSLGKGGILAFSLFSEGTMVQVKELTGVGLEYLSIEQLLFPFEDDMDVEVCEITNQVVYFEHPREVLRHIQKTGVSGVSDFRWTVSALKQFEQDYLMRYRTPEGIPLDYVSTYIVARKRGNKKR